MVDVLNIYLIPFRKLNGLALYHFIVGVKKNE